MKMSATASPEHAANRKVATDKTETDPTNNSWLREESYELFHQDFQQATRVGKRARMIRYSVNHAWTLKRRRFPRAQFLEFGVHQGKDLCRMAVFVAEKEVDQQTKSIIHGFDSFQGLPEAWENGQYTQDGTTMLFGVGAFDVEGRTPQLNQLHSSMQLGNRSSIPFDNIEFHKGWFHETLPDFLDQHLDPIAFVHADADLYTSTLTFLDEICQRKLLVKGSVITFDEFWNYENWQHGEYKAWCEIVQKYDLHFAYLCYHAPTGNNNNCWYGYQSVSVVILKDMK